MAEPARPSVFSAYLRLLPVALADLRRVGAFYAFFSILLPAGILFFVTTTGAATAPDAQRYIAAGALTASLAMGPALMLCVRFGIANENDEFDYWASLPVPRISLILALVSAHLLFSLPGVLVLGVLGLAFLGVTLPALLAALLLVPLSALAMTALGAVLGARAPNSIAGNLIGNMLLAAALFLSPLMNRIDAYPGFLRPVTFAVPTTYVADAFRHVLGGAPTYLPLAVDLAILVVLTVGGLTLVHRLMDWRGR